MVAVCCICPVVVKVAIARMDENHRVCRTRICSGFRTRTRIEEYRVLRMDVAIRQSDLLPPSRSILKEDHLLPASGSSPWGGGTRHRTSHHKTLHG